MDFPKEKFYSLIETNSCYLENKYNDEICSEQQLNDILEGKINILINNLNKQLDEELLNNNFCNKFICIKCKKTFKESREKFYYFEEKNKNNNKIKYVHKSCNEPKLLDLNNNSKCFVCKKNKKKSEPLYYFEENIYFHKSCNPIDKSLDEIIDLEKYKIYQNLKTNIINDPRYKVIRQNIQDFFEKCEHNFSPLSTLNYLGSFFKITNNTLKIDDKIIKKEIKELKKILYEKKIDLFGKSIKIIQDEQKIKKWKENWKEKINKDFNDNKNKTEEWIILKSWNKKKLYNNKYEFRFNYEIKKKIKERIIVNLYEIMSYAHSTNLTLSPILHSKEFIEKEKFENYFHQENEGLIIYKDDKKIRIYTNGQEFIEFIGLYDYDNMSKTLIVYKEEDNRKKIGIYFNKENKHNKTQNLKIIKDLDINSLFYPNSKLYKIKLIPLLMDMKIKAYYYL